MKKRFSLIVVVSLLTVVALAAQTGNRNWTPTSDFELGLGEKGVTIEKYKGKAATVNIPAVIDGISVVAIGGWAFASCSGLTSIIIPTSVTAIGNGAFWNCRRLSAASREAIRGRFGDGVF